MMTESYTAAILPLANTTRRGTGCNQTCPKDAHDIAGHVLSLEHEVHFTPETLV